MSMKLNRALLVLVCACLYSCARENKDDSLNYINSYIGSTGATDSDYGGTIPAVAPPFAMTQWVAMTRENFISNNPYNYRDTTIIGFLGTHQPAIWMGDYGFISFLPSSGAIKIAPTERALKFLHKGEKATPYSYSVEMQNKAGGIIRTEMASSQRCAIFNIRFPEGADNHLFIEASRKISEKREFEGFVKILPESNEIIGYNSDRHSFMLGPDIPNFKGYFVIQISKPFTKSGVWNSKV